MLVTMLDACAYVGSGHVLKIQKLLHMCSERHSDSVSTPSKAPEKSDSGSSSSTSTTSSSTSTSPTSEKPKETKDKDKDKAKEKELEKEKEKMEKERDLFSKQAIAVLGIALMSMGEDISCDMVFRHFGNLVSFLSK